MKIHLVIASHFSVPGLIKKAYANKDAAESEAARLVNIMVNDTDSEDPPAAATNENWPDVLQWLQDYHGAQFCYVGVEDLDLE